MATKKSTHDKAQLAAIAAQILSTRLVMNRPLQLSIVEAVMIAKELLDEVENPTQMPAPGGEEG